MSNATRSYLAGGTCASVPREIPSTRWVLHSMVVWSNGAANWKNKSCCSTTLNTLMPPTPPTHRHLHNATPTVTQIHLLWLFCLEKQKLISLTGRTVTGRGRIIKLATCNKMCWFKLGLKWNCRKPGKMRQENQSSHSNPVKGGKKKSPNTLFQPSQAVSSEDGIGENFWSNMCTAIFDLTLLEQGKIEKKLEEMPSSDTDPS